MTDLARRGHSVHVAAAARARVVDGRAAPSFDAVYEAHVDFVWRTVRRLGVADRHVDDAMQDVFVIVHRKLEAFEGRSSIKTWLFGIARRVAKDHRRRAERKERDAALPPAVPDPNGATPLDVAARNQAVARLSALLAQLPDDQREVFVLAELEQMTAPEIAQAIAAPVNTVYSRLRLARAKFNEAVARLGATGGQR